MFLSKVSILVSERLPLFYLKVVLVLVKVQFQNSFGYNQEKWSKRDNGKLLKVIEKVMEFQKVKRVRTLTM